MQALRSLAPRLSNSRPQASSFPRTAGLRGCVPYRDAPSHRNLPAFAGGPPLGASRAGAAPVVAARAGEARAGPPRPALAVHPGLLPPHHHRPWDGWIHRRGGRIHPRGAQTRSSRPATAGIPSGCRRPAPQGAEKAYRDTLHRAPDHGGALYRLAAVLRGPGKEHGGEHRARGIVHARAAANLSPLTVADRPDRRRSPGGARRDRFGPSGFLGPSMAPGGIRVACRGNGVAIPGATGSTDPIASLVPSDAGIQDAIASNCAGSATSAPAQLVVTALDALFGRDASRPAAAGPDPLDPRRPAGLSLCRKRLLQPYPCERGPGAGRATGGDGDPDLASGGMGPRATGTGLPSGGWWLAQPPAPGVESLPPDPHRCADRSRESPRREVS